MRIFGGGKSGPIVVSVIVTVGFVAIIGVLVVLPIKLDNQVGDLLHILLGTLAAKFGDVVQYHIGSSAGSRDKSDMLGGIVASVHNPPASSSSSKPAS